MDRSDLTAAEQAVVAVLLADWRDVLRCTTIDQAMERAGAPWSHSGRLRIAELLRTDPMASRAMRWALATYVLTNDEKLVARHIVHRWRELSRLEVVLGTDLLLGPACCKETEDESGRHTRSGDHGLTEGYRWSAVTPGTMSMAMAIGYHSTRGGARLGSPRGRDQPRTGSSDWTPPTRTWTGVTGRKPTDGRVAKSP